ncbi:MAG: Coenzyme F420 hydrogenase/dehydrogenase, beta subunit C-terminal domain [Phycisphaerae bacterium]|nr:Coenzyme F420 hydrogenase/dehydrogenase, beta subunit C-terminal domain [Phycisphaerae bacterium]
MKNDVTIESVVQRKLCTGCGTCAGICPQEAIEMMVNKRKGCYQPRLDTTRCMRCGLCYKVCPGHGVDFQALDDSLFGHEIPQDIALGRYLACYIGHASDTDLRYACASGGMVSALLIFALEEGLIDGALVTRMQQGNPLRPEPFIARTRTEILSAAGSKYCPVAAGAALEEILHTRGRFAVVGLPCHIQGIRKAEQHIPTLKERIRYRIAIPCSLDYSFRGTERILRIRGIRATEVESLQYRGRGWPGSMSIRLTDGTERTIPLDEYFSELSPHSLRRCTLCSDMLGELSDLTCGDAWIPEVMRTDKTGSSFVVSRTPEAEELLEAAASKEAIALSELGLRELLAPQGNALFKKRKLPARMRVFRWAGRSVPTYNQTLLEPTREDYINTLKFYAARYALSGNHAVIGRLFRAVQSLRRSKSSGPSTPAQTEALV